VASLDRERDAVVVRIVYDGPPTAGKTTSLKALAERLGQGTVHTPQESSGRTLFFDWLEYVGGRFEGRQIRCQIVSVPGQRELAPRRRLLVNTADAVVFVADTSRAGYLESNEHLEDLIERLGTHQPPVGVVLQANKRDLPGAVPLSELHGRNLAVIESVASRGEGIREAFVFAVRLALDRVRELVRLGQLGPVPPEDPAENLLNQMRALPLNAFARALWPGEEVESTPEPAAVAESSAQGKIPRVPTPDLPGGWIWPPVNGRVLLQEAGTGMGAPTERTEGEWLAESESGWRFHSGADCVFADLDEARGALIRWAQLHAAMAPWLSSQRCIALTECAAGTYRMWQVVRAEPSLWQRLTDVLSSGDRERITASFSEAANLCSRAAQRWAQAPCELPCTLETVGAADATPFVSWMPPPTGHRPPEQVDRRARLWSQLHQLAHAS